MSERATRLSRGDEFRLREIHDAVVALGAECLPSCRFHVSRRDGLRKAGAEDPLHSASPGSTGPEIVPDGMTRPARAAALAKVNPNWADEPRISAGDPRGGEWTSNADQNDQAPAEGIELAAARLDDTQAKKERFVDAHLADAQKAAKKLGVPVENILGLSALESGWGEHRFAIQGNNYFGIHYPAPLASGYMLTTDNRTKVATIKVATFASYADSLQSFAAISGFIVQDKRDPEAFAAALQNSRKFGIDPDTGEKVPTYVRNVAGTIRGLRSIIARRGI